MKKGTKKLRDDMSDASKLHQFWDAIQFIIIDEISMVSARLLDMLDQKLRLKFNSSIPFAGRHVFFFGDFLQHAPIPNIPAYKSNVWQSLTHSIELNVQVRACKDPAYVEFLKNVRNRKVSHALYDYLNTRLWSSLDDINLNDDQWFEAPFVTTRRKTAAMINQLKTITFANKKGVPCVIFTSVDSIDGQRISSPELMRKIINDYSYGTSKNCVSAHRILHIAKGSKVMLTDNIATCRHRY